MIQRKKKITLALAIYKPIFPMISETTLIKTDEQATVFGVSASIPGKYANIAPINSNAACREQFQILTYIRQNQKMSTIREYRFSRNSQSQHVQSETTV